MARPKRAMEPTNNNVQATRRMRNELVKTRAEVPKTDGHEPVATGVVNRKRKIASVKPFPTEAENVNATRRVAREKSPVEAKRTKETLPKRASLKKKVAKRGHVGAHLKNAVIDKEPVIPIPTCPKLNKGEALAVGTGDVGQLGLGSDVMEKIIFTPITDITETVVDIAAGGMHSACLTSNGNVYTFGCNDDGTLGRLTEEEEDFNPGKVELPEKVVMISTGDTHTAALTESGAVFIWGSFRDSNGIFGLTATGQTEPRPLRILEKVKVAGLASGAEHLVCLGTDGHLYTMGSGEQGQLGRIPPYFKDRGGRKGIGYILTPYVVRLQRTRGGTGFQQPEFDRVWTGTYCTFAREKHTGAIYGFGLNNYRQLDEDTDIKFMPTPLKSFEGRHWNMISGGMHHTLALDDKGRVYAWGRKDDGRLGLGDVQTDQQEPVLVPHLKDIKCVHIACGTSTSYAISASGSLYSWGFGDTNQLGHGNEDDALIPKEVESKTMKTRKVVKADGGGQHTLVLASLRNSKAT